MLIKQGAKATAFLLLLVSGLAGALAEPLFARERLHHTVLTLKKHEPTYSLLHASWRNTKKTNDPCKKNRTRHKNRVSWRGSRLKLKRCSCGSSVFVHECPVGFPRYVSCSGFSGLTHYRAIHFTGIQMSTQTGTVKWFNDAKGFGFITPEQGGDDLFAHFTEIKGKGFRTLAENQRVEFEVKTGPKGLQAANIRPI